MDGRLLTRTRTAVLMAFALALTVVPTPAVADSAPLPEPALPTIVSSFAPSFEGRVVAGGTQTVTVVASDSGATRAVIPLEPAPCTCTIGATDADRGTVTTDGGRIVWDLGDLGPAESAGVTVDWVPAD